MPKLWNFGDKSPPFSRRSALQVGVAGLFGYAAFSPKKLLASPTKRMAIIGGGMGGISTAYFCDSDWNIDLFESRFKLGGHADTVVVQEDGLDYSVDVGAEFFNAETHPMYWTLLNEIDAIRPTTQKNDLLIEAPASLSIFDAKTKQPFFVSSHPFYSLGNAINFAIFASSTRKFLDSSPSTDVTVGEWFDTLKLDKKFKTQVLLPWLASLACGNTETLKTQAVVPFLLLFARTFPENIFKSPKTYNSNIGLAGFLEMLVNRCKNLTARTDSAVTKLETVDGAWYIETANERHGPYEKVVINAPPHASVKFMQTLPAELVDLLGKHEYYEARVVIHSDPIYMPKDPKNWCTQNAAIAGDLCEGSIWLGGARKNLTTGKPLNLFKSWASLREEEPQQILAERKFLHPLSRPATMRAAKQLQKWQGKDGLYFTGHYTMLTDLQETALYSGVSVAKAINPTDSRLQSLMARMTKDGLLNVHYDI